MNAKDTSDDLLSQSFSSRNQNITTIPTWCIGDYWQYEADIISDTENGVFDLTSDDLRISIINIGSIFHDGRMEQVYDIFISGNITGEIQSSILSGDIEGEIIGNASIRQADLSLLLSNITISGIIEYLIIFESDFFMKSHAEYYPRFEYFDFPLKTQEEWNTSTQAYQNSSFYVETFFPENSTEGNISMSGYAECLEEETITVPAGSFQSYHLISENNGSIESWYAPEIENMARIYIDNTNQTETSTVWMNLTSYQLHNQQLTISSELSQSTVNVSDPVTISGYVNKTVNGTPLTFTDVTIHIPYTNDTFFVNTDGNGFYTKTFIAPLILDSTNTSYDIGSDGIIISVDTGLLSGFTVETLTVIGVAIDEVTTSPLVQYETLPVNITCIIYTVEPLVNTTVSINGPLGFTPVNISLQQVGPSRFFFKNNYDIIGNYSYYIWAKNDIGNTNKSDVYSFTIIEDIIPPMITDIQAQPNPQYETLPLNISCLVTDNVGVDLVKVIITDPIGSVTNNTMNNINSTYFNTLSYQEIGQYSYSIWVQDTLGNTNISQPFIFTILEDTQPPEITDIIVLPDPQLENQMVNISCSVTDNVGVDLVYVSIYLPNGSLFINQTMQQHIGNRYYYQDNYSINGTYSFQIWAVDIFGYSNLSSMYTFLVLNQSSSQASLSFVAGWNLITIAVESSWNASDLAANLSGCLSVSRWDQYAQSYWAYLVGGPSSFDFVLEPGYGYFVEMDDDSNVTIIGPMITSVQIPLKIQWNLIGWYHEYNTTAMNLSNNILGCLSVSKWDPINQSYWAYLVGGPSSFDFNIENGMGLFVEIDSESIWQG